ncbi:Pancreatic alpha-amylase [Nymphon striatum]|nr:Pancreatic alpha-amylase [Nymphon striatum]
MKLEERGEALTEQKYPDKSFRSQHKKRIDPGVSPPNEHAVIFEAVVKQPWWQRYQPVSYKLVSRSGNEKQFRTMVDTCNKLGVSQYLLLMPVLHYPKIDTRWLSSHHLGSFSLLRIYVDAVTNHMTGGGSGKGSDGTSWNGNTLQYPGVPYGPTDFNGKQQCHTYDGQIHNYNNEKEFRNCRLAGLTDLNQAKDYVREKIAGYMNHLISIGVAGFRMDAAKHMWPGDLAIIYGKLNNLNTKYFPVGSKPFIFQEVIDYGSSLLKEYQYFAGVTEFKFSEFLAQAVLKSGKSLSVLKVFGEQWDNFAPSRSAVVFTDNHDSERDYACKYGLITERDPRAYKIGNAFALAWPYGFPKVLSGYTWDIQCDGTKDIHRWIGPPHNSDYSTSHVVIDKDNTCPGRWTCTHRWRQIYNMVRFRTVVGDSNVMNWWDNGKNQISFSRGNAGFIVINNDGFALSKTLITGLSQGTYCDIISGDLEGGKCTGKKIYVDSSGKANIYISNTEKDPMMATHLQAKLDSSSKPSSHTLQPAIKPSEQPPITLAPVTVAANFSRTVIFLHKQANYGDEVFLRGGLDNSKYKVCTTDAYTSRCAIPIKYTKRTKMSSPTMVWAKNDLYLDWYGAEKNQGRYQGRPASGSPMSWTTNDVNNVYYNPLNVYGPHYWILDIMMDCSRTSDYWFEAKAVINTNWEGDISQEPKCSGDLDAETPFMSKNHVLKCGAINVVNFDQGYCKIYNL